MADCIFNNRFEMKKLILFASALMLCIFASAQDGREFYHKYSDAPGVSAVYFSPAMFRVLRHIPDVKVGADELNLTPIIKSLTGMYMLSSSNSSVNDKMYRDISKHIKNNHFELLMEAKDNGEAIRIYTLGDEKIVTNLVLYSDSPYESNYICIDGKMPRAAIEEALVKANL